MGKFLADGSYEDSCYICSGVIVLSPQQYKRCYENGDTFYCSQGHGQVYTETKIDKLRAELDAMTRDRNYETERADENYKWARELGRSRNAYKGQCTKYRIQMERLKTEENDGG
jgi:hypothetical protein